MKAFLTLLTTLVVCMTAGCSAARQGQTDRAESSLVRVTNNNWLDVNVFAVRGDRRVRLGTVGSMTTEVLRVRGALAAGSPLQLQADPIGSSTGYSSEHFSLWPGQVLSFSVENQLSLSRVIATAN